MPHIRLSGCRSAVSNKNNKTRYRTLGDATAEFVSICLVRAFESFLNKKESKSIVIAYFRTPLSNITSKLELPLTKRT